MRRALDAVRTGSRLLATLKRPAVGYGVVGSVAFLVFLVVNFPYDLALSRLLAPLGLELSYSAQSPSLPLGISLSNVSVTSAFGGLDEPVFSGTQLEVAPVLESLAVGQPGLAMSGQAYGGFLSLTVERASGAIRINFNATSLSLGRYPALRRFGVEVAGLLSGRGEGLLDPATFSGNSARIALEAHNLTVRFAQGLAPVRLGTVVGNLDLKGRTIELRQLNGHGADLTLDMHGTVALAPDPRASLVNLILKLDPTASGRSRLGFLLNLLPHQPGVRPYRIRGRIYAPSVT